MDDEDGDGNEIAMNSDSEEESLRLDNSNLSPTICKEGIENPLEELLNNVASGWKYHVSNTDPVKQAWLKLDNATTIICGHMSGKDAYSKTKYFVYLPICCCFFGSSSNVEKIAANVEFTTISSK